MKEQKLLQKLRARERSAIQHLYNTAYQLIENYVRRHLGDISGAKDIFQDSIIILYKKIDIPDFKLTTSVQAYLLGICKYLVIRQKSKAYRNAHSVLLESMTGDQSEFEKDILEQERYELFSRHFEQLGESCKKVLSLYFQKKSMADIARIMGFSSVGYAKKRKFNCQKKLIKMIKEDPTYHALSHHDE